MWLKDEKVCFISWNSSVIGYIGAGDRSIRGNDPIFENSQMICRRRETSPGECSLVSVIRPKLSTALLSGLSSLGEWSWEVQKRMWKHERKGVGAQFSGSSRVSSRRLEGLIPDRIVGRPQRGMNQCFRCKAQNKIVIVYPATALTRQSKSESGQQRRTERPL